MAEDQTEDGQSAGDGGATSTRDGRSTEDDDPDDDSPTFEIPARPERNYTPTGGVEYVGETAFHLKPDPELAVDELEAALADVLDADRYVRGDWFDLPRPVFLVHDEPVSTSFRVVVRSGRVELHVLPSTEAAGLRELFDRLRAETDVDWTVDCRVDQA